MSASKELLINVLVTRAAVSRCQFDRDGKPVMLFLVLPRGGLMTIQAIHALAGVRTYLVFVHDRVLRPRVALGAFTRRADKFRAGLFGLDAWSRTIDQEGCQD
jgi:hypothetical protein